MCLLQIKLQLNSIELNEVVLTVLLFTLTVGANAYVIVDVVAVTVVPVLRRPG